MKLSVTLTAGQHPVAGNMVAIEARVISDTGKKIAKAVLIGLGVLVVVAVVALVAVAAADGGGAGEIICSDTEFVREHAVFCIGYLFAPNPCLWF